MSKFGSSDETSNRVIEYIIDWDIGIKELETFSKIFYDGSIS